MQGRKRDRSDDDTDEDDVGSGGRLNPMFSPGGTSGTRRHGDPSRRSGRQSSPSKKRARKGEQDDEARYDDKCRKPASLITANEVHSRPSDEDSNSTSGTSEDDENKFDEDGNASDASSTDKFEGFRDEFEDEEPDGSMTSNGKDTVAEPLEKW